METAAEKLVQPSSAGDPTARTTAALWREIEHLKELTMTMLAGQATRIDGIDRSIELSHADLVRVPTDVQKQVGNLKDLHDEKFSSFEKQLAERDELRDVKFEGVEKQFRERDVRVEQTARDTKVAVDAALQAAEKAVGKQNESFALSIDKSEAATMKQIDAQAATLATATGGLNDKIDDVKQRLTRLEQLAVGESKAESKQQTSSSFTVALIGVIFAVLIGCAGIIIAVVRAH